MARGWITARGKPAVVDLDDGAAADASRAGAKAANLARSRAAGLPALPGFVLTVDAPLDDQALAAYRTLSGGAQRPVVVRSSSVAEDGASSSAAGRYRSVVGVAGEAAFRQAVSEVRASAGDQPMAVLVQPHLDPAVSGVAFSVDPVSGRDDHTVIAAVAGGPQDLVAGLVEGDRYVVGRWGRCVAADRRDGGTSLSRRQRRLVRRLAAAAVKAFGGPQDIEWALTADGRPVLLQARPVTAASSRATGPVYGPGPLAETFPDPLSVLEQDLWLPPLRDAIVETAVLTGRVARRRALAAPVVVAPGGRPAVDLSLAGDVERPRGVARLDPRPGLRRLGAAWRAGRLAAAIGAIGADVVAAADAALEEVGPLEDLDDRRLLTILDRARAALRSLHAHEILAGALAPDPGGSPTGFEVALHALRRAREQGLDDDAARRRAPEVLGLTPPRVGAPTALPVDPPALRPVAVDDLGTREALRLRVRWVHELSARVAAELGHRLATRGSLADPLEVRNLHLTDLAAAVTRGGQVRPVAGGTSGPPLPARFRIATDGTVVTEAAAGAPAGTGAGGGRAAGPVHLGDDPADGAVLVVDVLAPHLAPLLPRLAAIVAETGSPLSHLAILAREHGVAVVVGVPGARARWAPGETVVVDGTTGEVATAGTVAP